MEEENKIISFLSKHWSKLLMGIVTVACIAAWTERLCRSGESQSKEDFLTAQKIFTQLQKGEKLPSESIETAETIINRHPELHPKFDALLALNFFSQYQEKEGVKYAESLLNKVTAEMPPFYKRYARCTLLIEAEQYPQAYQEAFALHEHLKEKPGYQTLDAMNTLRLVFLSERLNDKERKQIFWKELENHPGFKEIQSLFNEGTLSLENYIKAHE